MKTSVAMGTPSSNVLMNVRNWINVRRISVSINVYNVYSVISINTGININNNKC